MIEEFPQLDYIERQEEFLADWWSARKLYRGDRKSGKTTLMMCEARRFKECGFDVIFVTPSKSHSKHLELEYQNIFGEMPLFDLETYDSIERGVLRGTYADVVILDEFQNISLETFNREIQPMKPAFVRASACMEDMSHHHYLYDIGEDGFFDLVYES